MRLLRLILVAVLAVLLIGIALANRSLVTVGLFPGNFGNWLGGGFRFTMPLFIVIIMSVLIGMVLGLIWEWMRESGYRAAAQRRAFELARAEREAGQLRRTYSAPRDDVLAIIDAPRPAVVPAGPVTPATLPARR